MSDVLELELQEVVSLPTWVQEHSAEPVRAISILNHGESPSA